MIVLIHTDLPDPVAPAIRRCGIPLRSAMILLPEMSFPTTNEILDLAFSNSSDSRRSLISTDDGLSFSTSMPTAALPGIGASILIDFALRLSAISSASLVILLTLTPVAGWTSYLVTEAPCVTVRTFVFMNIIKIISRDSIISFEINNQISMRKFFRIL